MLRFHNQAENQKNNMLQTASEDALTYCEHTGFHPSANRHTPQTKAHTSNRGKKKGMLDMHRPAAIRIACQKTLLFMNFTAHASIHALGTLSKSGKHDTHEPRLSTSRLATLHCYECCSRKGCDHLQDTLHILLHPCDTRPEILSECCSFRATFS